MNKLVELAAPVWLAALGRSIMPIEGPIVVSPEIAEAWQADGLVEGEPTDVDAPPFVWIDAEVAVAETDEPVESAAATVSRKAATKA